MANVITIPYKPRPFWGGENGIHAYLDNYRFSVLVAHRRFGKTVGIINQLIKRALTFKGNDGRFGYVAPYRNQAKYIAWDYLKRYTAVIPGKRFNESELAVELPNGSKIRLFGADNADALRGLYFDGLVVDEVADIAPYVWGEILRPALADRNGWCAFIGTPKGQNLFFDLYNRALSNDSWFAGMYRADETNVLPENEMQALKAEMSENQFRQEMLCDFTAAVDNALISLDDVMAAEKRSYREHDISHAPLIIGVDVARFGDDESVIFKRKGLVAFTPERFKGMDNMTLASIIADRWAREKPAAVFVDGGRGEGVIDRLRQLGYRPVEINFGGSPNNSRYVNKRAEMWGEMAEWVKKGQIPKDNRLRAELTLPTYSFDAAGKLKLEAKEKMKERSGFSPDCADALALTFALPVVSQNKAVQKVAKMDYELY